MRRLFIVLFLIFTLFIGNTSAEDLSEDYYKISVDAFVNSPSEYELEDIEDDTTRYCEEVYLEATRRREYTTEELEICGEIFEIKKQQELDYMYYVLGKRGIFY